MWPCAQHSARGTETFRKQLCFFSSARAWSGVIKTCRIQKAGRARGRSDWKRAMKRRQQVSLSISLWGPGKPRALLSPGKMWMQKWPWWLLQRCHLKNKQRSGDAYLNLESWNEKRKRFPSGIPVELEALKCVGSAGFCLSGMEVWSGLISLSLLKWRPQWRNSYPEMLLCKNAKGEFLLSHLCIGVKDRKRNKTGAVRGMMFEMDTVRYQANPALTLSIWPIHFYLWRKFTFRGGEDKGLCS